MDREKLLFVSLLAFFLSCKNDNIIEKKVINEAKWTVYYMNNGQYAKLFHSDYSKSPQKLDLIECSLKKGITNDTIGDTIEMYFRFYYKDTSSIYILSPPDGFYVFGVGVLNGKIVYPVHSVGRMEIQNYPDSLRELMKKKEKEFIEYLMTYSKPQKIDPWLREEMKKRGIRNKNE